MIPRLAERSARRPSTVTAAPAAAPTRKPACKNRCRASLEIYRFHVGKRFAEHPLRYRPKQSNVTGRELQMRRNRRHLPRRRMTGQARVGGCAASRPRRLQRVDRQQLRQR